MNKDLKTTPPTGTDQQKLATELIAGCTAEQWEGQYDFGRDTSHIKIEQEFLDRVARARKACIQNKKSREQ